MPSDEQMVAARAWHVDWLTVARSAFPEALSSPAQQAAVMFQPIQDPSQEAFVASVHGDTVRIPGRIYPTPPSADAIRQLGSEAQTATYCLLSRHHDGRVRQEAISQLVRRQDYWVVPFVVSLLGEYVVEIVEVIQRDLDTIRCPGSWQWSNYGKFANDNLSLMRLTSARSVSYWNCYYRDMYPSYSSYPAARVLADISAAASALAKR